MNPVLIKRGSILGWVVLYLLIAGALQLYVSHPWDTDTAYHVVLGKLIREHGILHAFPWTPFSWLADHYADKELLFHLLFVPLASVNWIIAAKIVGTLTGTALLLAIYLILRSAGVRLAGLWALVPLSASVIFIFRFALVRPHLLSITLAFLYLWAAARGRLVILAAVSAIYPWAYVAFWQIPFLLLLALETALVLSGERLQWRPAAVTIAGLTLGVVLHPNATNLLHLNWVQMVDVLFRNLFNVREGFDMGGEFLPLPVAAWVQGLLISVLMIIAAVVYAWRNRRKDTMSLAFAFAALGFFALTIRTARFLEYFVPFSAAAMALISRWVRWRFLLQAILGASIIYTGWVGSNTLLNLSKAPNNMPLQVASILQEQIPTGSQIFTTDWEETGILMLTLPDRHFMVALDPTFFYLKDPELYRLWYRLIHQAPPGLALTIRQRFRARYVLGLNKPKWFRFYNRLGSEHGVRTLLVSQWILLDLGSPPL